MWSRRPLTSGRNVVAYPCRHSREGSIGMAFTHIGNTALAQAFTKPWYPADGDYYFSHQSFAAMAQRPWDARRTLQTGKGLPERSERSETHRLLGQRRDGESGGPWRRAPIAVARSAGSLKNACPKLRSLPNKLPKGP